MAEGNLLARFEPYCQLWTGYANASTAPQRALADQLSALLRLGDLDALCNWFRTDPVTWKLGLIMDTSVMEKITGSALQGCKGKIAMYKMKPLDTVLTSLDPSVTSLGSIPAGHQITTDDPGDFALQSLDSMPVIAKITAAAFPVNALIRNSDYPWRNASRPREPWTLLQPKSASCSISAESVSR